MEALPRNLFQYLPQGGRWQRPVGGWRSADDGGGEGRAKHALDAAVTIS